MGKLYFNEVMDGDEHQLWLDNGSIHLSPDVKTSNVLMKIGVDIEDDGNYVAEIKLDEAAIGQLIISLRVQLHKARGE